MGDIVHGVCLTEAVNPVYFDIRFWGRCTGCNPPSVLSSICLIGEPAPPAEDHRRLLPLSHRCRDPFHPQPSILNVPRERTHHRHLATGQGLVSAPLLRLSPGTSYGHNGLRHVGGVSSRPPLWAFDSSPARRLSQRLIGRSVQRASSRYRSERGPHMGPTPCAIGDRGLNVSTEVLTRTPRFHQPHLLWEQSSQSHNAVTSAGQLDWHGCLFSGEVSGLDAFSPYPR